MNSIIVKASEIGEYVYCQRTWWLRFNEELHDTPAMLEGTKQHEQLSSILNRFTQKKLLALTLISTGSVSLIILILLSYLHML